MSKKEKAKASLKVLRSELEYCRLMGIRACDSRRMYEMTYWTNKIMELATEILWREIDAMPQKTKDLITKLPEHKPRNWIQKLFS